MKNYKLTKLDKLLIWITSAIILLVYMIVYPYFKLRTKLSFKEYINALLK